MTAKILVKYDDERAKTRRFMPTLKGDVGIDLGVWFPEDQPQTQYVEPFSWLDLPTGLSVKVDDDSWGCLRPRSSTFRHRKLFVMEGTIDSGYTGKLFIIVFNPSTERRMVTSGDRIAQLILVPKFASYSVKVVRNMPMTERGISGFGSTGLTSKGKT